MEQHEYPPAKKHTTALVLAVITGASAGVLVLVLLIILAKKYWHKISCCCDSFKSNGGRDGSKKDAKLYETLRAEDYWSSEPGKSGGYSKTIDSIDKYKNPSFHIPGKISTETVQPRRATLGTLRNTHSVSSDAWDGQSETRSRASSLQSLDAREGAFFFEYPQLYSPLYDQNSAVGLAPPDDGFTSNGMSPQSHRRKKVSEPHPNLGTISLQLQYEDSANRTLVVILQSIQNIVFPRPEIEGVYASLQLTPVREFRHISKQLYRNVKLNFNENFYFKSGPSQRDFGARTILITVICVEKSSKHINYGEARVPLLGREIFSQVPANLQLPIQPISPHNEIGDAEISLTFSAHKSLLTVQVNSVRFPTARALESVTEMRIKGYLNVTKDKARQGKKQLIVKEIAEKTMVVEFPQQLSFELLNEDLPDNILKLRVQGRQRFTRRTLSIGKIEIGQHVPQGGAHWGVIQNHNDITWRMWHPVCAY